MSSSAKKEIKVQSLKPHVTEKASSLNGQGGYVFKVDDKYNKIMIKEAIKKQHNVICQKVRIINLPSKTLVMKGRRVKKPGYKKAVIFLKKGDKINI